MRAPKNLDASETQGGYRPVRTRMLGLPLGLLLVVALGSVACSPVQSEATPPIAGVTDITVSNVDPPVLLPGSRLVIKGSAFVPAFGGASVLHLNGLLDGAPIRVQVAAHFIDYDLMEATWPGGVEVGLPSNTGLFSGTAEVRVHSTLDGLSHRSVPLSINLDVRTHLTPRLDSIQDDVLFVNDPVVAHGEGFLLGGSEGKTIAVVEGCFTPQDASDCGPVAPTEVVGRPFQPFDRTRLVFPFAPQIAGIKPGKFEGTVRLINRHSADSSSDGSNSIEYATGSHTLAHELVEPTIFSFSPSAASLGQFVDVAGGGFVGPTPDAADNTFAFTTINLQGTFTTAVGDTIAADLELIPEFRHGQFLRYVLNTEDELGRAIDLRRMSGTFAGSVRPIVQFGDDIVAGTSQKVTLGINRVKQVVWLRFFPAYVESLRHFGLRAMDGQIRDRVLEVVRRDYAGINVEFMTSKPEHFKLFSEVEIGGPDPNGKGYFGYDNTPGKDDGNVRLHDKIGGLNAETQLDYPGFGGVFVESMFSFSKHPGNLAKDEGIGHSVFDDLFDSFRPDLGATPVAAAELAGVPIISTSEICPANDRATRIACAARALGSLIGTTLSHELGHSLGLADPGGSAFHNAGDFDGALMDSGGSRPFLERAELLGHEAGHFCEMNFKYLQWILPTGMPDPRPWRVECF